MRRIVRNLAPGEKWVLNPTSEPEEIILHQDTPVDVPVAKTVTITLLERTGRRARCLVEHSEATTVEHVRSD